MSANAFAGRVLDAMRLRGVTLRQLCRDVELDASFFSKVLSGKRSPPVEEEVLRRIARRLELDPAELVVCAGRIPEEWQRLWADAALFRDVHALASSGAPDRAARPARSAPAASAPRPSASAAAPAAASVPNKPPVRLPAPRANAAELDTELL